MTFHCPHCHQPIDPAIIRKAANSDAGSRKRPGAKGLVRNPTGKQKKGGETSLAEPLLGARRPTPPKYEPHVFDKLCDWRGKRKQKSPAD